MINLRCPKKVSYEYPVTYRMLKRFPEFFQNNNGSTFAIQVALKRNFDRILYDMQDTPLCFELLQFDTRKVKRV